MKKGGKKEEDPGTSLSNVANLTTQVEDKTQTNG